MKVQIVYLDPHDDYISARDKLGWIKSPRAVLVWPRRGRILHRRLDLVVLQRYAKQRGFQLGVLSHDPEVRENAAILGIPLFDSLEKVPEEVWRRPRSRRRKLPGKRHARREALPDRPQNATLSAPQSGWRASLRPAMFSLALLALMLVPALVTPRAEVTIDPVTRAQELEMSVLLDPLADEIGADNRIPVRIARARVRDTLRVSTSGSVRVPSTFANGAAQFTNLTSEPVEIPEGTGLRSSLRPKARFNTTEAVELPPGVGEQAQAPVVAVFPGRESNLPAGQLDSVEGPLGLLIAVSNPEPMEGGGDVSRRAVSARDQRSLEAELYNTLRNQAERAMAADLEEDEVLLGGFLVRTAEFEHTYDRALLEPAESVSLSIDAEFEGRVYRLTDVFAAASMALNQAAATGWEPVPGTIQIEFLRQPFIEDDGLLRLELVASQEIFRPVSKLAIRRSIRGKTPAESISILERRLKLSPTQVILYPGWLPRLPILEGRIEVLWPWET